MNKSLVSIALAAASLAASDSGGLPGVARIGSPLPLPFRVALARGLRSPAPDIHDLSGAVQASSTSIAASGAAALLYSESTRRLQFVDGLPGAPRALDPIDVSFLGASPAATAVDPAGSAALGRLRDAALAASAETGDVLLIEGWNGTLSIRPVAGPLAGIDSARDVQALGGRSAAVISGDGSLEWIPLAAKAEDFAPLDSSRFALNRAGAAALLLLDAAKGRSVWFGPPVRPPARPRGHDKNFTFGEDQPY